MGAAARWSCLSLPSPFRVAPLSPSSSLPLRLSVVFFFPSSLAHFAFISFIRHISFISHPLIAKSLLEKMDSLYALQNYINTFSFHELGAANSFYVPLIGTSIYLA